MKKQLLTALSCCLAAATLSAGGSALSAPKQIDSFRHIGTFVVPNGGVAEIISATPDGRTIAYTNSGDDNVGIVDFNNPRQPKLLKEIAVPGEPTSVSITADGKYAVAAVNSSHKEEGEKPVLTPGKLVVIDMKSLKIIGGVNVGEGPDSVSLTKLGGTTLAVVAIENEPVVVDAKGNLTDAEEPGLEGDISGPGYVQIVAINFSNPKASPVKTIKFPEERLEAKGLLFPADPQPEFVDIKNGKAAVTLQENNGVALIDLKTGSFDLFSLGKPKRQMHDLTEDGKISFTESYPEKFASEASYIGARMPDAVAWNARGTILYTADEGEMDLTGGRGWSAWSVTGAQIWKDNGSLERIAAQYGHYPEGRSEAGGIEVEGLETAVFGKKEFAFVGSEKGSFVGVYDITNNKHPKFVQLLSTGMEPEGLLAIPQNNLFLTSDEDSGTITVFEGITGKYEAPADQPVLHSSKVYWSAISGLASDEKRNDVVYAVPDNAMEPYIYKITLKNGVGNFEHMAKITDGSKTADLDMEGIVRDTSAAAPATGGFWLANEGNAKFGKHDYMQNQLIQVDMKGNVLQKIVLPAEVDSSSGGWIRNNGFEGVAISSDGNYILGAIQREYKADEAIGGKLYTRIVRYDLTNKTWEFFLYPLEAAMVEDDWIGLSEIVNLGGDVYAVIERDKQVGGAVTLKAVYTFTLDGVEPFEGLVTASSDISKSVVTKKRVLDLRDAFAPFEKIEGMTVTPDGSVWTGLDNDGGEVKSVFFKAGELNNLLK
ncbi:esterase-like activity of phytase family protein [Paenibacillus alkalitolerans]|uniref:esterase-like activity of phytase family protein n=1 Tax=Paenibacillus alkalitolerans TaxID=2799335 RepID=UPI0018F2C59F|nr:esterase-like activity of phytase family protein [Paenibacillus alkalitolerans]